MDELIKNRRFPCMQLGGRESFAEQMRSKRAKSDGQQGKKAGREGHFLGKRMRHRGDFDGEGNIVLKKWAFLFEPNNVDRQLFFSAGYKTCGRKHEWSKPSDPPENGQIWLKGQPSGEHS